MEFNVWLEVVTKSVLAVSSQLKRHAACGSKGASHLSCSSSSTLTLPLASLMAASLSWMRSARPDVPSITFSRKCYVR